MSLTRDASIILKRLFGVPTKVKLLIHHQFPGIELVSPMYISDGSTCYLSPVQRIDVDSTAKIGFNIDPTQKESIGVLMYKLQRKNTDELDEGTMFSEDETTYIQLFTIWKVTSSKEFHVVSHLIEHDKDRVWDRDRLKKLVERCKLYDIQYGPIEETWLMHDNTVLSTRINANREAEYYKIELSISEASIKYDTLRLEYIDVDR
jgi:hypothetical protein